MTTTIRLSGPADILTVLPYQLGFHPRECLVVVCLNGSRMGLVQRIDLPPSRHVADAVAAMIGPLVQARPSAVLLVGFEEREGQSLPMLDQMNMACKEKGVRVDDRLVVRGGRWFDVDCQLSCCPPQGLLLPDASDVPAVAEYVGREICPLPDRAALADLLEPGPLMPNPALLPLAEERSKLRKEAASKPVAELEPESESGAGESEPSTAERGLRGLRASELAVWARVLCGDDDAEPVSALPLQDLVVLAVSLTDVDLRDGLISWLCPGTLAKELIDPLLLAELGRALSGSPWAARHVVEIDQVIGRQRVERRLCELCAALPDTWAVPILTVLASFAWWQGDGALTRVALDRALRIDRSYRLAVLLERMVDLAIRPARASA